MSPTRSPRFCVTTAYCCFHSFNESLTGKIAVGDVRVVLAPKVLKHSGDGVYCTISSPDQMRLVGVADNVCLCRFGACLCGPPPPVDGAVGLATYVSIYDGRSLFWLSICPSKIHLSTSCFACLFMSACVRPPSCLPRFMALVSVCIFVFPSPSTGTRLEGCVARSSFTAR